MKKRFVFLPLLGIYIFIVLLASPSSFQGDEKDYVWFAQNLSHGFYSPQNDINLWFGPGYPAVLLPFILLRLPWLWARFANTIYLFLAVLYFYTALRFYMKDRKALVFSYLLGLYPPFLRSIYFLYTEMLAIFLICAFLFYFCKIHQKKECCWPPLLAGSACLGYLALTKIFFGYVIAGGIFFYFLFFLWRKKDALKKTLCVYTLALVFCLPYLFYTYSLTGKIFYWGNSGGLSLYWMSSPYPEELGSWQSVERVSQIPELSKNHQDFFNRLSKLTSIQRDAELKKQAISYIIHNPRRYFRNWLANIGRLAFNYPYSFASQRLSTYVYIIPNIFLVSSCIICLYFSLVSRKLIPSELSQLLVFGVISFGGSSLLSAYFRQSMPLVPLLVFWISFVSDRLIQKQIRK